jgi:ribonuclease HIII
MADLMSFHALGELTQKVSSYFHTFLRTSEKNSLSSSRLMVGLDETGIGIVFGGGRDASWRLRHSDA